MLVYYVFCSFVKYTASRKYLLFEIKIASTSREEAITRKKLHASIYAGCII